MPETQVDEVNTGISPTQTLHNTMPDSSRPGYVMVYSMGIIIQLELLKYSYCKNNCHLYVRDRSSFIGVGASIQYF